MDVSVLDRDRRPVRGLTAADFTVLEDGAPRPVVAFTPVDLPDVVSTGAPWLREIPSDVTSNRADAQRVVIVLLDDFGVPFDPGVTKTAKRIATSVVERLGPADLAAVVFTVARRGGQEWTTDRRRLLDAIERFLPSGITPASVSQFSASLPNSKTAVPFMPAGSGACPGGDCVYQALENAGKILRAWSGVRKTLVLIGPGQRLSYASLTQSPRERGRIAKAFAALQEANVTVYQFDPRGLEVARPVDEDVDLFTDATGGRAVHDTNTPWDAVPQMFRENSSYYLVGFQPAFPRTDGTFRRVTVNVARPGVEVRTRAGYFAPQPDAGTDRNAHATPLARAIVDALPKGDLPIALAVVPFANPHKKRAALVVVAGIDSTPEASPTEVVEVEAAAFSDTWKSAGAARQTVELTRSATESGNRVDIGSRLDLAPGRYQIRLAIHNPKTGRTGSVHASVTIPDFARAPLTLSGIVFQPEHASAAVGPIAAVIARLPTTIRSFRTTENLTAFLRIYQGTARTEPIRPVRIQAKIQDANGGLPVEHSFLVDIDRFSGRTADCRMAIPVSELAPGEYLLSVDAESGDKRAVRDVRFTVAPDPAAVSR